MYIKDHIGRARSFAELSKGQEVEHRKPHQRYIWARVEGFYAMTLNDYPFPNVVFRNKRGYAASTSHVTAGDLAAGKHIVRRVGWVRRHLRPIKGYSYD